MYYYIKGEKVLAGDSFAVIDAGGVGYRIWTSSTSLNELSKKTGVVTMYVQLIVREDAKELYGFCTNEELMMFKHLISVSGVGPKAAVSILSVLTPSQVAGAVYTDDSKSITAAQGVGPKIAKRIILELRDKLKDTDFILSDAGYDKENVQFTLGNVEEAICALAVLGYSSGDAKNAISKLDAKLPVEDLIREALKLLN